MFKKIILATLVAASFGAAPLAASARTIVITEPPPPPREEPIPSPRRGEAWAPGHWAWRNGHHVWVAGHWMHERRGMHWVPARWAEHDGRWVLREGHWERGMRERQHAIRDRDDRHRMGNRGAAVRLHDRDRDGVPDRYDSRPDNPNRY